MVGGPIEWQAECMRDEWSTVLEYRAVTLNLGRDPVFGASSALQSAWTGRIRRSSAWWSFASPVDYVLLQSVRWLRKAGITGTRAGSDGLR